MGGYISSFLCNIVGFAYPTYASFKALESPAQDDDTQWLVYWVVYSIFSVIESFSDFFIFWVPFYYELKLLFLILLQVPQLKLASTLYHGYIRPLLKQNEKKIDSLVDEASANLKKKAGEAFTKNAPQLLSKMATVSSALNDDKKQ